MFILLASVYKELGSLAVIVITLWLGGFGYSLCCATGTTDSCCLNDHKTSAQATTLASEATSCDDPSADCSYCKSSSANGKTAFTDTSIKRDGGLGCSLLPSQIDGVAASGKSTHVAPAPQVELPIFTHVLNAYTRAAFVTDAPTPLNRGGTYLRCCALLI
jgi:hypothetical protein